MKTTQATISTPKTTAVKGHPISPASVSATFISGQYPPAHPPRPALLVCVLRAWAAQAAEAKARRRPGIS